MLFEIRGFSFYSSPPESNTIATAEEVENLIKETGLTSLPTMTYPRSRITVEYNGRTIVSFDTLTFLSTIIKDTRKLENGAALSIETTNPHWANNPLKRVQFHDWTFWPQSSVNDYPVKNFRKCAPFVEDVRFTSTEYPILHSANVVFYEDELDDNGIVVVDVRIRLMEFGFLIRQRSLLMVSGVLSRCRDLRFYHCFGESRIFRREEKREAAACVNGGAGGGMVKIKDILIDPTIVPLSSSTSSSMLL